MALGVLSAISWVIAAGLLGLTISGLFSGWMRIRRRAFLVPYVIVSSLFLFGFFFLNSINVAELLLQNWLYGVIAGGIVGAILARNVLTQPPSKSLEQKPPIADVLWVGVAYGVIDALMLNVMPVVAVWIALEEIGVLSGWSLQIMGALISLGASLFVTALYHVGYTEFRNRSMGLVLVGNTIITLAYLLSTNPLGAILSHAIMHIAAVVKGPESTMQLPPHYSPSHS